MKATRPFIPPTGMAYIEALEANERVLRAKLEEANEIIASARHLMAEMTLDEAITVEAVRLAGRSLIAVVVPGVTEETWWRRDEEFLSAVAPKIALAV